MAREYVRVRAVKPFMLTLGGAALVLAAAFFAACSSKAPDAPAGDDTGDDGAGDDGGAADAGADVFALPSTCTSNQMWTRGDLGDEAMHPGRACISCHTTNNGPAFGVGGTVFPTGHEPDDCDGVSTGVTVIITDATGKSTTLVPNSAGNFYSRSTFTKPIHAKVVRNGVERVMNDSQENGDCNFCHTQAGANGAPGRIVEP
jgi:hypothetical protein